MNIEDIIENAQLKGRIIALDAQVETLTAEVRCLEAVIRSHERVDCLTVANLKAEVERLHSQFANSEQENTRLKAEVESLKEAWVDKKMQEDRDALLQQVERLRKAGDELAEGAFTDLFEAIEKWNAAKEGKPSV